MRRLLATISNVDILLPGMMLGACLNCMCRSVALSEPLEPVALEAGTPPAPACGANATGTDELDHLAVFRCLAQPRRQSRKISRMRAPI